MTTSVDVLAVMEQAACALRIDARHEQGEDMEIARAAVAELIEASEAYANGEYHDIEIESRCDYSSRRRKERYRVNAALARVKGA